MSDNIITDIQADFDSIAYRAVNQVMEVAKLRAENARLRRLTVKLAEHERLKVELSEARDEAIELGNLADSYLLNWEAERKRREELEVALEEAQDLLIDDIADLPGECR